MEQLTLSIPKMWADHHVLAVVQALAAVPGVGNVEASAAQKAVRLSYDPALAGPERIVETLRSTGYDPVEETGFPIPLANKEPGSAWFAQGLRITQTNRLDLEMSGDFRKY